MTIQLVTDEKIAETSSKGNQEKWYDRETDRWYKLDQFGYESLAETVVSLLLERSNIEHDTPFTFVRYQMERLQVHGRERTGCSSKNFPASVRDATDYAKTAGGRDSKNLAVGSGLLF